MSYSATVVKVIIASPSDVPDERSIIREVIHEWNAVHSESKGLVLMPIGWETHASPEFGHPQEVINKQVLAGADLLVAIFWTRIGSATKKAISGTIEEIELHIGAGKPAMLYFSSIPVSPQNLDRNQLDALDEFRTECQKRSLYETYSSIDEFRKKFSRQLAQKVLSQFDTLPKSGPVSETNPLPSLSSDAVVLLFNATKDSSGEIIKVRSRDGLTVQTNGMEFVKRMNARDEARWEAAVDELLIANFIQSVGPKGEIKRVTKRGFDVIDLYESS